MLAVAKCGYDNDYGKCFAPLHDAKDLQVLKDNEILLTIEGGVHMGELYPLMVIVPASLQYGVEWYYAFSQHMYSSRDWGGLTQQLLAISDVMARNYSIFKEKVWGEAKAELLAYAADVRKAFDENGISAKIEKLMGLTPGYDEFQPIFANSLAGGAEAIDISDNRHIFGIGRDTEGAVKFISHEYIISLIKQTVGINDMPNIMQYWIEIESLAAYYYGKIFEGKHIFVEDRSIIEFYESKGGMLGAKDLLFAAIERD